MSRLFRLVFLTWLLIPALHAQTPDSVTIVGRIRGLTVPMYRQNPAVTVSRNNILQPSRELARPAPLQPDGSFEVRLPVTFPVEELYFNYGAISTPFLASAGRVEVNLEADSLFVSEVPFRFGGVHAAVNNELSRYKAFEFKNKRPDIRQIGQRLNGPPTERAMQGLQTELLALYDRYRAGRTIPPLLDAYLRSVARDEAAAYLYDRASAYNSNLRLVTPGDSFLTLARTTALDRYSVYVNRIFADPVIYTAVQNRSVPVRTLAGLIEQHVGRLSADERTTLERLKEANSARGTDMSFLNRLYERNEDTLSKVLAYEAVLNQYRRLGDTTRLDYLRGRYLVQYFLDLRLNEQQLLYTHVRPQLADPRLQVSLDELYRLEQKDSARIRQVTTRLKANRSNQPTEVLPGVLALDNPFLAGNELLNRIREQGRGRLIYLIVWAREMDPTGQEALAAKQLLDTFSSRDLMVVYICVSQSEGALWQEWLGRTQPTGLNLLLNEDQFGSIALPLRMMSLPTASLLGRNGKFLERRAPLPSRRTELDALIRKNR